MNEPEDAAPGPPQANLRQAAERRLRKQKTPPVKGMADVDVRALVHELQVHQIELEMQNEELQLARTAADEAAEKFSDLFDFAPVGYFLWDHEGRILEVNLAGAALLGLDRSQAVRKRFGQFAAAGDRARFAEFCRRVIQTDDKQTCEVQVVQHGRTADVLIEGIAAADPQGPGRLCRAAVIDVTAEKRARALAAANEALQAEVAARRRTEEAMRRAKEEWEQTFNSVPDLMAVLDDQYRIVRANRAMAERLKVRPEECVGWRCYEVVHGTDAPPDYCPHAQTCRDRREHTAEIYEERLGGHFLVSTTPRYDAAGRLIGTVHVARDIGERKRAEAALLEAKAAAEAANEAKSRFLANISHELRTPMNAILGMIDLALPKQAEPMATDCLKTARESAGLLLTLLNDLLDSAKIESGTIELEAVPFSLRRLIDHIRRVLELRAGEKGLVFSCHVPDEIPDALVGDQVRLRQILFNLSENAVKFTEQGEVTVSVRVIEERSASLIPNPQSLIPSVALEFAVMDTGIGIPLADQDRVFQPFAQADASTTRRFGGTGLGLSICARLVALMGGRIGVESKLGTGSTFHFAVRLPLAAESAIEPEAPSALSSAAVSPLRVLLAEDNPANQKLATYILQERGHAVDVAGNGRQAIAMALEKSYDVILMDLQMPGMDGLESTAAIRAAEREKGDITDFPPPTDRRTAAGGVPASTGALRTPIIAMTAHAMKGDQQRCLAGGMDGYLSKPINTNEMIALVERLGAAGSAGRVAPACRAGLPGTFHAPREENPPAAARQAGPTPTVFNAEAALKHCLGKPHLLQEVIAFFFKDTETLLPQIRAALARSDLMEVGRLGHRFKGTIAHLAADAARDAAKRVERFHCGDGDPAEAAAAVAALERECEVLKRVLSAHRGATPPAERD